MASPISRHASTGGAPAPRRPAARIGYWELTIGVPRELSEGLTNRAWELGALGVVEEERPGSGATLRAFFPETIAASALEDSVRRYLDGLAELGFEPVRDLRVAALADENWAEAWRAHFTPRPVGQSLLIVPPWDERPANGRIVITIEPGRAFGTGHHGTTAGCLEALEAVVERDRPSRMIDVGTGSGILAIAAARLGSARSSRSTTTLTPSRARWRTPPVTTSPTACAASWQTRRVFESLACRCWSPTCSRPLIDGSPPSTGAP